jgi:L-cysteine:1D-myo-inositol 2-amino-2-deoxy-alpha-D-glucopyranoside ligase
LHSGMVRHEGEKMSKSLGNLVYPAALFQEHEPAAVRLALLAHHWRSSWTFDADELKVAAERLDAWRRTATRLRAGGSRTLPEEVEAALATDLDTPAALAAVDAMAKQGDGAGVQSAAEVLGVRLDA